MSIYNGSTRDFHPGMGQAVAERTVLRRLHNGSWEEWGDVTTRVAHGNSLLSKTKDEQQEEYRLLKKHLAKATTLMSGRHLQHGDTNRKKHGSFYELCNCPIKFHSFLPSTKWFWRWAYI